MPPKFTPAPAASHIPPKSKPASEVFLKQNARATDANKGRRCLWPHYNSIRRPEEGQHRLSS